MSAEILVAPMGATPAASRLPQPLVVDCLRKLLAQAEAGDIQCFAYALVDRNGFGDTSFHATEDEGNAKLSGWIARLQFRFQQKWDECL